MSDAELSSPASAAETRLRERFLVSLVLLIVIAANVPPTILDQIGVERNILIAVLALLIVLALFLYLRFFFFLLYTVLIVGANLPDQWAQTLGVSRDPLLISLICMVLGSTLNYVGLFLPTGAGPKSRKSNKNAMDALIKAISKQQLRRVHAILEIEFNLDQADANGMTPLMRAAQLGNNAIVKELLTAGADAAVITSHGTAAEVAARAGFPDLAMQIAAGSAGRPSVPALPEVAAASQSDSV